MELAEPASAKLNLALHIRGKRTDGRHDIETLFAFCTDGDRLTAEAAACLSLRVDGPFAADLGGNDDNLVMQAARQLAAAAGIEARAALRLTKNLPVSSGIGGGSADAAATLRLLTRLWRIDPSHASAVAPCLGADVPACLLSLTARGEGVGDRLTLVDDPDLAGTPVLLVNPLVAVSTAAIFTRWNGNSMGGLGDWREGGNDLEAPARALAPVIGEVLRWLEGRPGATIVRMSGSGATCFALFDDELSRLTAAAACPDEWWHLATFLR